LGVIATAANKTTQLCHSDAEGLIEIVLIGTMKCKDFRDEIARTCLILLLLGRIKLVKNQLAFYYLVPARQNR